MNERKKGCSVVAHKASNKKDKHSVLSVVNSILDSMSIQVKFITCTALAYGWASQMAYSERGYFAVGGEVILAVVLGIFFTWVTE